MADGEKEKEKKRTVLDRARKLFLTGVVTTGILLGGIGIGRSAEFEYPRGPPTPQQAYYKINYKEGWNALMKGNELLVIGENSKGYVNKAIKYFEKEKKKNKDLEGWNKLALHYILDYCYYLKAGDEETSAKAEMCLRKAIESATSDYEKFRGSKDNDENIFLDIIILSYRDIGYTYFIEGGGDPDTNVPINSGCLKIAKENFQKSFELYTQYKKDLEKIDEKYPAYFEKVSQHLKRINQLLRIEEKAEAKKF
jgi:tetratricopeptide (TPR) repeat protein